MTDVDPWIGRVLGGKYLLTDVLGEGGFGRVFAAKHQVIGRRVAVKVLHPGMQDDEVLAERFLREARAASAIDHPGIIDVLDADQEEDGTLYMVMEHLQGESLGQLLERQAALPPGEAASIVLEVLDALASAHAKGTIHRDLKPENIFLMKEGAHGPRARILDFGISRLKDAGEGDMRLTKTGTIMGTPYYMAPEQARGAKDLDEGIDIWAVGALLYQMLSGVVPFDGDSYNEILIGIVVQPVPPLTSVATGLPHGLVSVVERALAKERADRYESADAMAAALAAAIAGDSMALDATVAGPEVVTPPQVSMAPTPTPVPTPQAASAAEVAETRPCAVLAGGFWRRLGALVVDLVVFSLVVGSLVDIAMPSSDLVDLQVRGTPLEGVGEEEVAATATVSTIQVDDDGIRITGDDGEHVRIDETGIHVRGADGRTLSLDSDALLHVGASGATSVKISLWILYCTLFLSFFGATPGKRMFGLCVVEQGSSPGRVSFVRALLRSAFFMVSCFVLFLGCLWCVLDPDRRCWHDRWASTRVIHSRDEIT